MAGRVEQTPLTRAPQRPPTRPRDVLAVATPLDRSNPHHPAGTDPRNVSALLRMEFQRRGRHGDTSSLDSPGTRRWPRQ